MIFAVIFLALIVLGFFGRTSGFYEGTGSGQEKGIAVVHLSGVFQGDGSGVSSDGAYNHKWIMDTLDDAIENENNEGMVLYVDSPGGAVYHIDQVYRKLCEYKDTGRPLHVYVGSMAASGGYYVSAPADKIVSDRNSIVGSIGVITGPIYDISELLEKYGIKSTTITSGKNKGMGSMTQPLTEEQKKIYQDINDEYYQNFVSIVAEGRGLSEKKVRRLADGRVYTARQAMDNGLIDEIGTLESTIAELKSENGLEHCGTYEKEYINNNLFDKIWAKAGEAIRMAGGRSDLSEALELAESQSAYPVYYLMGK